MGFDEFYTPFNNMFSQSHRLSRLRSNPSVVENRRTDSLEKIRKTKSRTKPTTTAEKGYPEIHIWSWMMCDTDNASFTDASSNIKNENPVLHHHHSNPETTSGTYINSLSLHSVNVSVVFVNRLFF
jgi:hypothetical protein